MFESIRIILFHNDNAYTTLSINIMATANPVRLMNYNLYNFLIYILCFRTDIINLTVYTCFYTNNDTYHIKMFFNLKYHAHTHIARVINVTFL